MSVEEQICAVQALDFFKAFSEGEVSEVVEVVTCKSYSPGVRIIVEGDQAQALFVLVSGEVSETKAGKRIGTVDVGDCFKAPL